MSDIKLNTVQKYIIELSDIINTPKQEIVGKHKKIINLLLKNYGIEKFIPIYNPPDKINFIHPKSPDKIKLREEVAAVIVPSTLTDRILFAYDSNNESDPKKLLITKKPFIFDIFDKHNREALCDYEMPLHIDDKTITKIKDSLTSEMQSMEDRALGCMMGMAIGDSLGAPYEFLPYRPNGSPMSTDGLGEPDLDEIDNRFKIKPGQWTDDTSMGLCLADSLLASDFNLDPLDLMMRFSAWWNLGYNNAFSRDNTRSSGRGSVGLGGSIGASLNSFKNEMNGFTKSGTEETSGNGSIMRLAPVPILYYMSEDSAAMFAKNQSYTTHKGLEAAHCAALMAIIIVRAINSVDSDPYHRKISVFDSLKTYENVLCPSVQYLARSEIEPGGDPNRDWRWMVWPPGSYMYSPKRVSDQTGYVGSYAMDALAMALHCVYATDSVAKALLFAANIRGDCDSVAAITGQIAGAIYGYSALPVEWINLVEKWDRGGRIKKLALSLFHRIPAKRD